MDFDLITQNGMGNVLRRFMIDFAAFANGGSETRSQSPLMRRFPQKSTIRN